MQPDIGNMVRNFLIDNFLFEDDGTLSLEMSLIENGIIDSTGVLELVDYLENTFEIRVEDEELIPENLNSIQCIAGFIKGKQASSASALT